MALITLAEAKLQCRISNSTEDDLLTIYISSAENWISNYLNQDQIPHKPAVKAAALMIVHDLYENRGATGDKDYKDNPAIEYLLFPYRVDMGI